MNDSAGNASGNEASLTLPRRKGWLGRAGCVGGLVLLIAFPIGLLLLSGYSLVIGEEFSPQTFETRRFTYSRLPWFGTPLSRRTVTDSTAVPQQLLLSQGLVVDPGGEPRWDLVSDNWQPEHSADFDAAILVGYLRMGNPDGEDYWPAWNDANPDHAQVLWPLVAELAREDLYLVLPPLFRIAMEVGDGQPGATAFSDRLRATSAAEVRLLARAEREAGDAARAGHLDQLASRLEQGLPEGKTPPN